MYPSTHSACWNNHLFETIIFVSLRRCSCSKRSKAINMTLKANLIWPGYRYCKLYWGNWEYIMEQSYKQTLKCLNHILLCKERMCFYCPINLWKCNRYNQVCWNISKIGHKFYYFWFSGDVKIIHKNEKKMLVWWNLLESINQQNF